MLFEQLKYTPLAGRLVMVVILFKLTLNDDMALLTAGTEVSLLPLASMVPRDAGKAGKLANWLFEHINTLRFGGNWAGRDNKLSTLHFNVVIDVGNGGNVCKGMPLQSKSVRPFGRVGNDISEGVYEQSSVFNPDGNDGKLVKWLLLQPRPLKEDGRVGNEVKGV